MKMLILFPLISISLAIVILSGCEEHFDEETVIDYTHEIGKISRVEIEGHSYLVRHNGHQGGICHDENCPCKTNSIQRIGNN